MRVTTRYVLMLVALAALQAGCRQHPHAETVQPRVESMTSGPVDVRLVFDPPRVRLDRDLLLTVEVTAPSNNAVRLPDLDGRLEGLSVAGHYDREPEQRDGRMLQQRCARLTPELARRYRLAPMAIQYTDDTGRERWFPTRPVVLESQALSASREGAAGIEGPVWIRPPMKTIGAWLLGLVLLAAALWGLWRLVVVLRHRAALRRLSAKERALRELDGLLHKDLVGKGLVKEFYFALTLIVRSYIERAHAVRAPEQTTEEFLAAVSRDPRFGPDVVRRLQEFLQAADLVKYAAYLPAHSAVDQSIATAKTYIATDAEEAAAQAATRAAEQGSAPC